MTRVSELLSVDYKSIVIKLVLEEIHYLKVNSDYNKERINIISFDPENSHRCFYGQVFGYYNHSLAMKIKESFIPTKDEVRLMKLEGNGNFECSILELWAINKWQKGEREEVLNVVNYLNPILPEVPKITF